MVTVYKYDDDVSVEELFLLIERMMSFDEDRFPAGNVFHVALRDEKKEEESLKNCISVTARGEDGILTGYLRILGDRVYIYYILDVMVDPSCRNNGVGAEMVRIAVDTARHNGFIKIFLTAIPGTEEFYSQFGFKEGMSPVLTLRGEDQTKEQQQ